MNTPSGARGGRFKGVDYFNGGLFKVPARIELFDAELDQLRLAAKEDWSKVRPEIFGTLFEHSLEKADRHAYGGHFTTANDIMKIVVPTITEPWRDLIENARTLAQLEKLRQRILTYRVLDPACGSGNFLYLAYRELKRLEVGLHERIAQKKRTETEKGQRQIGHVTAAQFFGIDINPFAIELAKVTMMIARKLAIDELHTIEQPLPLDNLDDNFFACDALFTPISDAGRVMPTMLFAESAENPFATGNVLPTDWPAADVIIGNPPFLGAKRLKPERGADYVNAVRKTYKAVPGMADYCVYWIRRAHDHLPPCTKDDPVTGRAGLVGTQNIRNNKSRVGGLDHVVSSGTIIEAVDNQPWSGEANVHVSIVNWVKTQDGKLLPKQRRLWYKVDAPKEHERVRPRGAVHAHKDYELAYRNARHINSALSDQTDVASARELTINTSPQRVFQGLTPGHSGFVLTPDGRAELLRKDGLASEVLYPYLIGQDILGSDGTPSRYLIDFQSMSVLEAERYSAALRHVKVTVLPDRQQKAQEGADSRGKMRSHHKQFLEKWWRLSWERSDLVKAVSTFERFLVCSRVTKRPVFVFVSNKIRPGDALQAFAVEDDYSFGILQSNAHWHWFITKCSKLTERFRYTPESVFDTFPWPQKPTNEQIDDVANAGREVRRIRTDALTKIKGGLRAVYRTLELPGKNPLKDAHTALDRAVLDAYRFDPKADLLKQLLDLNLDVADRIDRRKEVIAPGIPPSYPQPKRLVSNDCVQPPKL